VRSVGTVQNCNFTLEKELSIGHTDNLQIANEPQREPRRIITHDEKGGAVQGSGGRDATE